VTPGPPEDGPIETLDLTAEMSGALKSPDHLSERSSPPPIEDILPSKTAGKEPVPKNAGVDSTSGRTTRSGMTNAKGKKPAGKKQLRKRKGEVEQLLEDVY
jgi:hypothetical protein